MAEYEKLKENQEFFNEEDLQSSSDDSTIIARPLWRSYYAQYQHLKTTTVLNLLLGQTIMLVAVSILLIWILINLATGRQPSNSIENAKDSNYHHSAASSTGISSCGKSATEAVAAGCHFDLFSFGWYPPECTDLQVYNDSMNVFDSQLGDAPAFFLRAGGGSSSNYVPLDISVLHDYALGKQYPTPQMHDDQEVLGTWEQYLVACAYAWQKVQRAAMRNWPIDEWSSSYALANQCGQDLLHREKRESGSIMWHLKPWYPRCGLEAEDLQQEITAALNQQSIHRSS